MTWEILSQSWSIRSVLLQGITTSNDESTKEQLTVASRVMCTCRFVLVRTYSCHPNSNVRQEMRPHLWWARLSTARREKLLKRGKNHVRGGAKMCFNVKLCNSSCIETRFRHNGFITRDLLKRNAIAYLSRWHSHTRGAYPRWCGGNFIGFSPWCLTSEKSLHPMLLLHLSVEWTEAKILRSFKSSPLKQSTCWSCEKHFTLPRIDLICLLKSSPHSQRRNTSKV